MSAGRTAQFVGAVRRRYHDWPLLRRLLALPVAWRRRLLARSNRSLFAAIEQLGERIVGDVVLDLAEFEGTFACSPRSHLFARVATRGCYEPDLVELVRRHTDPKRDFIDVGANVGFYSVLAARLLQDSRVLAIEPNPEARARLIANLSRNRVETVVAVYGGVASDHEGEVVLNAIAGMEEYSSMGAIVHASVADRQNQSFAVPSTTIDRMVAANALNPGFIKIDVEGAEQLVLDGANETLKRFRPVLLSELSPALLAPMGADARAIVVRLEQLGYRVVDAADPALRPGSRAYGDILCLPD